MSARPSLETPDQRVGRALGLSLLLAVVAAPMAWSLGYSLLYSLGGIGLFSDGWTLQHWRTALQSGELAGSLLYSGAIACVVTSIATTCALGFVLFAPQARSDRRCLALLCLGLATPVAVTGLLTYQLLNPGGYLARLAFHAGSIASPSEFPTLVNDRWSIGLIVAQSIAVFPLLALFFLNTWSTARLDRYCALAESLGATRRQARLRVALPMLLRRGAPLILLMLLWQFGSYEIPLLLGRQSPQMFSVMTQRHAGRFDLLDRPEAFALAVVYLLLVGAGVCVLIRWRRRRADDA